MNFVRSEETSQPDEDQEQLSSELQNESSFLKSQQLTPADLSDSESQGPTNDACLDERPVDQRIRLERSRQLGSSQHSPSTSVSSEEVVFLGRNNIGQATTCTRLTIAETFLTNSSPRQPATSGHWQSLPTPDTARLGGQQGANALAHNFEARVERAGGRVMQNQQGTDEEKIRRNTRRRRMSAVSSSDGNLQAALDDYTANLRANGEIETLLDLKESGTLLGAEKKRWPASDVEDIDETTTSEEVIGVAQQIMSKRYSAGRVQYLVVWENRIVDEASWIPGSALTMPGAADLIKAFEDQKKQLAQETESDEPELELNWSSSDFDLDAEEDEDSEDDRDRIESRQARMTG